MTQSVSPDMTIEEIFSTFPHKSQALAQEMQNFGLHCVGCHAATWETLEAGVLGHGRTHEELASLVDKLNAILNETTSNPQSIEMSEFAAQKYMEILDKENKQGWGIRFAEKPSGCNGFEYVLDFSKEPNADDEIVYSHGIEIHIHKDSLPRLLGSYIDYIDGLQGAGFKISNPNVRSSCSCGSSHGY